jgi:hypothetical protein
MPWHVEKRDSQFCVIKDADGSVSGCHESRAKAIRQVRALYANDTNMAGGYQSPSTDVMHTVPTTEAPTECPPGHHKMPDGSCMANGDMPAMTTAPWEGVLTMEGVESGDGRMFAAGSLTWDTTPPDGLPLMWQKETSHGGKSDVSVRVGSINEVWRAPDPGGRQDVNAIMGRGFIDLGNPDGAEVYRRMKNGFMSGNSVDVDSVKDANVELVYSQPVQADEVPVNNMFAKPTLTKYHKGRVRGSTLVEYPAFTEARLGLTNTGVVAATTDDCDTCNGDYFANAWADDEVDSETVAEIESALVAATKILKLTDLPPREWFNEPTDVTPLGALTITDEGRVYGYLAPAGVRHRSFRDRDVYAPADKVDFSRFMSGETIVADGGRVVTGRITMNCNHATTRRPLSSEQSVEHYENSCSIFATGRVGVNRNGTWFAGAVMPGVKPEDVQRALACNLSGDWRGHLDRPGWRELTAALLVPVPGFPMARTAASVRVEDGQLVASAVPVRFTTGDWSSMDTANMTAGAYEPDVDEDEDEDDEVYTLDERLAIARRVSASIGRNTQSRLAPILARRNSFR